MKFPNLFLFLHSEVHNHTCDLHSLVGDNPTCCKQYVIKSIILSKLVHYRSVCTSIYIATTSPSCGRKIMLINEKRECMFAKDRLQNDQLNNFTESKILLMHYQG